MTPEEKKRKKAERAKKYYEENKDKLKEYRKKYREENKDKFKGYRKKYYEKNKCKDKFKEYRKKYYEKNRGKYIERAKEYNEKNKDKIKEYLKKRKSRCNGDCFNCIYPDCILWGVNVTPEEKKRERNKKKYKPLMGLIFYIKVGQVANEF